VLSPSIFLELEILNPIIFHSDLADSVHMNQPALTSEPDLVTNQLLDGQLNEELGESVTRYVVVDVNQNFYGMSTESTVELMSAGMIQITRVPHSPKYISGVINHRGTIIPVIDFRALLGFSSRSTEADQLSEMFTNLKGEHVNWLNMLEDSVIHNTEFSLTLDPTMCEFGKWFSTILTDSSTLSAMAAADPILKSMIERFDAPHRRIHSLGEKVRGLKTEGKAEEALELINKSRETDLRMMEEIFESVLSSVSTKFESMLVITEIGSRKAAIAVDGVSFVADCNDENVESLPDTADNTEFLSGLVHQSDGTYILIADLAHIYNTACPVE
jgi:chemotaxis signal transduction protein